MVSKSEYEIRKRSVNNILLREASRIYCREGCELPLAAALGECLLPASTVALPRPFKSFSTACIDDVTKIY